ncbi:hypothetical protein ACCO45_004985 [Purpureocillium lilacinum]|uniref:Uncharacterized protein n=1 Tax=Purpureocillium lilacinum TaxID=33203 RepID=A0ACC4DV35_PURLI
MEAKSAGPGGSRGPLMTGHGRHGATGALQRADGQPTGAGAIHSTSSPLAVKNTPSCLLPVKSCPVMRDEEQFRGHAVCWGPAAAGFQGSPRTDPGSPGKRTNGGSPGPGPLARSPVAAGFLSVVVVVEKPGFPSRPPCRRRHARMPSHPAIFAHLAHHLFHPSSRPLPTQGSPPDESTTLDDHPGTLLHSQLPDRDGPAGGPGASRTFPSARPVTRNRAGWTGPALFSRPPRVMAMDMGTGSGPPFCPARCGAPAAPRPCSGSVQFPGSKTHSHRALTARIFPLTYIVRCGGSKEPRLSPVHARARAPALPLRPDHVKTQEWSVPYFVLARLGVTLPCAVSSVSPCGAPRPTRLLPRSLLHFFSFTVPVSPVRLDPVVA